MFIHCCWFLNCDITRKTVTFRSHKSYMLDLRLIPTLQKINCSATIHTTFCRECHSLMLFILVCKTLLLETSTSSPIRWSNSFLSNEIVEIWISSWTCPILLCIIVITTGSCYVLQAAIDNTVCHEVEVDDEYQSNVKVKELMTVLGDVVRGAIYCVIYYLLPW